MSRKRKKKDEKKRRVKEMNRKQKKEPKCPIAVKGHPDHCCKLVGCSMCKNEWCHIGNPGVVAPDIPGYLRMIKNGVVISYMDYGKFISGASDYIVHNPLKDMMRTRSIERRRR